MRGILCVLIMVSVAAAAEDGWGKVRELKSGTELRITKREAKQPLQAKLDEALEDKLLVVIKDEQVAIAKDDIERLEYRPSGARPVTAESRTSSGVETKGATPSAPHTRPGPTGSSTSSLTIGGKPGWQLLYQKRPRGQQP